VNGEDEDDNKKAICTYPRPAKI